LPKQDFLQMECSFCHRANSVTAVKEQIMKEIMQSYNEVGADR